MMVVDGTRNESALNLAESYPYASANATDEIDDVTNSMAISIATETKLNPRQNRRCTNCPSCLRLAKELKD